VASGREPRARGDPTLANCARMGHPERQNRARRDTRNAPTKPAGLKGRRYEGNGKNDRKDKSERPGLPAVKAGAT
jgi:hypothetical protein